MKSLFLTAVLAATSLGLAPNPASAQYRGGPSYGYGGYNVGYRGYGYNYVPAYGSPYHRGYGYPSYGGGFYGNPYYRGGYYPLPGPAYNYGYPTNSFGIYSGGNGVSFGFTYVR